EVNDHTVTNHGDGLWRQDAGGQKLELKLLAVDDDGVPGVVSAVGFDHIINPPTEQVRCFAFALVAPLGSHDCDCWHKIHLSQGDGVLPTHNIERFSHPKARKFWA